MTTYYIQDNTTAMNCINCGKSKFLHANNGECNPIFISSIQPEKTIPASKVQELLLVAETVKIKVEKYTEFTKETKDAILATHETWIKRINELLK